jgi:integrase
MATLCKRKNGSFEVHFYDQGGVRKYITLGGRKYSEKTAIALKEVVETLLHYKNNGILIPDKRIVAWIESVGPEIQQKLGKAGLVEVAPSHTLKELWDKFIEHKGKEQAKGDIKESTLNLYELVRKRFFLFFKESELLADATKDRMQQWKDYLLDEIAEASVACYMKQAKTCFNWAVAKGWISKSPLHGVAKGSFVNRKNDHIVSMNDYHRLLDACPCNDWRCIIALCRIGGLRCPNEVLNLRWEDVNWEYNQFLVRSSKTERHAGKEGRLVPLFPELKKELEALFFDPASEGKEYVINRYRDASQNLRTTLEKIVHRAGLTMFSRPFDNMRMSRSNEVYRRWGAFRESQWIGHSRRVREDHYLDITDSDFQEAANWSSPATGVNRPQGKAPRKPEPQPLGQ